MWVLVLSIRFSPISQSIITIMACYGFSEIISLHSQQAVTEHYCYVNIHSRNGFAFRNIVNPLITYCVVLSALFCLQAL